MDRESRITTKIKKEIKMHIKVLGPGCAKCKETEEIINEVVAEMNTDATVEKVTDMMQIAGCGVLSTPAVVIDGKVMSSGKVPNKKEVRSWIEK